MLQACAEWQHSARPKVRSGECVLCRLEGPRYRVGLLGRQLHTSVCTALAANAAGGGWHSLLRKSTGRKGYRKYVQASVRVAHASCATVCQWLLEAIIPVQSNHRCVQTFVSKVSRGVSACVYQVFLAAASAQEGFLLQLRGLYTLCIHLPLPVAR